MPDQGGHVLIVEDELIIGLGLQSMLADIGFTSFAFASTARQALEQAQVQRPDLVTIDLGLLDGDGFEAVDAIARACGEVATIFVTGDSDAAKARAGAVVLEKPVTTAVLAQGIARARDASLRPGFGASRPNRHGTVIEDR